MYAWLGMSTHRYQLGIISGRQFTIELQLTDGCIYIWA